VSDWALNPAIQDKLLPDSATLTAVRFYDDTGTEIAGYYSSMVLTIDGGPPHSLPPETGPWPVKDTIEISVKPLWPPGTIEFDAFKALEIGFAFADRDHTNGNPLPHTLVKGTFLYDYNSRNVTRPDLFTGMLEVGIW
jgi:hypothetical protein